MLTTERSDHRDLIQAHVWGCSTFVLGPMLQDEKKILKWNKRSCIGQFLGYSEEHSLLIANVRHLKTGHVSPQYHCVFDDKFETVFSTGENDQVFEAISDMLWDKNRELYALDEFDEDGLLIYQPPPLNDVWLNKEERRDKKVRLKKQRERQEFSDDRVLEKIVDSTPEGVPGGAPLPVTPAPLLATPNNPPNRDNDNVPNLIKDGDSDDSSTDSSIIGFVPESEGELWADHPDIVPDIEPHVLPPPKPPPSPAVSSNEPEEIYIGKRVRTWGVISV